MMEELGNSKYMEWVAFIQIEQEAQEAANKKASSSGGNSNKISLGSG